MPYKRINKMGETRAVRIACGHIREIIGGNMGAGQEGRGGGDDDLRRRRRRRSEQFQLGRRRKKETGVGKTDKKCVAGISILLFFMISFFQKPDFFCFSKGLCSLQCSVHQGNEAR